ncbi:unnamed protein product [Allacma fusca]|uniref:Uncharacterized protein n=1 Tax=Allacma fusca TaxID=39272 RepID=A0A8J2L5G9_9HEXA|nr:unnamed protein product [Allacma fusca]
MEQSTPKYVGTATGIITSVTELNKPTNVSLIQQIANVVDWVHLGMLAIGISFNVLICLSYFWWKRPIRPALYFPFSFVVAEGIMLVFCLLDMNWNLHRCAGLIISCSSPGLTWVGPISAMFLYFGFGTIAGGEILHWECTNYYFRNDINWKIITVAVFSISFVVLALMNWQTCHLLRKLQQSFNGQKNASQFQWNLKYLKRTSHGIIAWYLIGWGPFCLAYVISGVDGFNVTSEATLVILLVARSLLILRALTSPFLYALKFRVIRRALLDMSFGC